MPQKEFEHYSLGSSKPGEWHGQIDIFKMLLEGICGKWIAEGMT